MSKTKLIGREREINYTKTRYALAHTYVTTFGVANSEAYGILQSQVKMDDLFEL